MNGVIKRDGRIVPFHKEKIVKAIVSAMNSTDIGADIILADKIAESISKTEGDCSVEKIQELIENKLMASSRKDVAKKYIEYRNERDRIRNLDKELYKETEKILNCSNIDNTNANIDQYSFSGKENRIGAELHKQYATDKLLTERVKHFFDNHYIYLHDYDKYSVGEHNCSPGNTWVKVRNNNGIKITRIEDIANEMDLEDGDAILFDGSISILSENGFTKIKGLSRRVPKENEYIYKIKTKNGFIELTGEHKVPVISYNKRVLKEVKDIKVNEYLIRPSFISLDKKSFDSVKNITVEQIIEISKDLLKESVYDFETEDHLWIANDYVVHNCLFADVGKLLKNGFSTRNGDVRGANSVSTAFQLIAVIFQIQSQVQFGGVAGAHIDYDVAPYVKRSFAKHYRDGLIYLSEDFDSEENKKYANEFYEDRISEETGIEDNIYKQNEKVYRYAFDMMYKEGMQSAQALYHNLNTLESRAGAQVPFTSINYGRDTSREGQLVTEWLLKASIDGIGKLHQTSIFPIGIFQHKRGVNDKPGTPNYYLKELAIESMCKRIYPNWVNCDFSQHVEDPNDIDTIKCTMGK